MQASSAAKSPVQGGSSRGAPTSPTPKTASSSYHSTAPADAFGFPSTRPGQNYTTSPTAERRSIDRFVPSYISPNDGEKPADSADGVAPPMPTILLRRLPANMTHEALANMLLFAEDLVDARLASHEYPDDRGLVTAVARFRTFEGALEVRNRLHGKSNATHDATMVVEVIQGGSITPNELRRRSSDAHPNRQMSTSASSGASSGGPGNRQSSRFNNAFQSLDRMSPTRRSQAPGNIELPGSDVNSHLQSIFFPQSPIGTSFGDRTRVSGKSVISDDAVDDETGELLKDPLAYAKSGQMDSGQWQPRNSNLALSRLANLKLDTNNDIYSDSGSSMISPPGAGYGPSRRGPPPLKSPVSEFSSNGISNGMSNGMSPMSPPTSYPISPQHYQRHQYPPANPADQNPPCNTLYVGNLPIDTSEDELKAMFSKQRGYKRLCFRTKHNGPMCFVEFEDISFATKALNELYGHPLHNSVKGGIRLSFSKNPLGVRTGQGNGMGPTSPMTSPSASGFGNIGCPPGFSTANGPPPGLPMPANGVSNVNPHTTPSFFPTNSPPLSSQSNHSGFRHASISGGYGGPAPGGNVHPIGTGFSEFPMGR